MNTESRIVDEIAGRASVANLTISVAESLTGGQLAANLAAGPDASTWFVGGVVAYASAVKHRVLHVPPGPVVCETSARAMATGVADLLSSDVAVAVTGVGGPDPQDGQPPGTVWWAVRSPEGVEAGFDRLDGSPRDVVAATVDLALRRLLAVLPPPADG